MSIFDIYSAVGTTLTLVGFGITIYQVVQARKYAKEASSAAVMAEQAANNAVKEFHKFEAVVDFTTVVSVMQEVRRLQRDRVWAALPERYSDARMHLIRARKSARDLNEQQKSKIQNAIVDFREMEAMIEFSGGNFEGLPAEEMSRRLLIDIDEIVEIFQEVRLDQKEA